MSRETPFKSPYAPPGQGVPSANLHSLHGRSIEQTRKHSGLGIASFALSIFVGLAAIALVVVAGVMEASSAGGIDEESVFALIVGLSVFAVIGMNFVGVGLGIAGLFQSNRLKVFPILGVIFNGLVVLGLIGLMILGAMVD